MILAVGRLLDAWKRGQIPGIEDGMGTERTKESDLKGAGP